ncbi:MAG TPA: hypothetical protein VFH51_09540 [Myxococcota bacterium]|nr:hypothetical protein [Myxococcota bacterium]
MTWKQDRYYSGVPLGGPSQPLPDEIPPMHKKRLTMAVSGIVLLGVGVLVGLWIAPEAPRDVKKQLAEARKQIAARDAQIAQLETSLKAPITSVGSGKLKPADRLRHEREGKRYVTALRRAGAQGAANLMEWFIGRWNQLLDQPQPDDRTGRRAATLSLLIGGMAANLNPGDYVPWQAEFLNNKWLGELHFDIDGDGLPGKRATANTHDGFANVSICQVAMALNQSTTDAQVLVMPDMKCDRADSRMSVFLQGTTFDDALNEFIRAVRSQGFLAVEKQEKGVRLILVGSRPPPPAEE